ncbi:MAG: DMT family transporter [Desulfuromonadia bacterium]
MSSHSGDTPPSSATVTFFLVLTTLFWGGSFLFNKIGLAHISPPLFVLCRFSLATMVMLLLSLRRLGRLNRGTVRRGSIVGLALGGTNLTFVFGVQGTSISRAGILNNLFVLFIPLICRVVWRERIGWVNGAGIWLATAGIWLLARGGDAGFNRGDLISTLCALMIAIHILTVSKVLKDDDLFLVSLIQFGVVSLMAAAVALLSGDLHATFSPAAMGSVLYCAIFPTVLCFTLQNRYQRYVSPTRAGLVYTLDPVWAILFGALFLGERLTPLEWFGCGLIFAALTLPPSIRHLQERRLISRYGGVEG